MWARVAGPELPHENIRIDDINLGPDTDGPAPPKTDTMTFETPPAYSSYRQTDSMREVLSPCFMWVDVAADSVDAATDMVVGHHVPILAASLSVGHSGPTYRIEIIGAQNRTNGFGRARSSTTAAFDDRPLDPERATEVTQDYKIILGNKYALRASRAFSRGVGLSDHGMDLDIRAAALLAFHQVLEAVSMAVLWETPPDLEDNQRQVLNKLAGALKTKGLLRNRVAAVRVASKDLDRLEANFMSLKIANAAVVLGLSAQWKARAAELGKLRNTTLGHVGSALESSTLERWFDDADSISGIDLARTMLEALILRLRLAR